MASFMDIGAFQVTSMDIGAFQKAEAGVVTLEISVHDCTDVIDIMPTTGGQHEQST